jgi:hypothetical protein
MGQPLPACTRNQHTKPGRAQRTQPSVHLSSLVARTWQAGGSASIGYLPVASITLLYPHTGRPCALFEHST